MGLIAQCFGIAAVSTVAVSLTKGRRHPSFRLSLMLLAFYGIANVTSAWIDPWMDAAGFYAALMFSLHRPRARWVVWIWGAFLLQLVSHLFFPDPNSALRMAVLNVLFAVELISCAFPGGINALRRLRDFCTGRGYSRSAGVAYRTKSEP